MFTTIPSSSLVHVGSQQQDRQNEYIQAQVRRMHLLAAEFGGWLPEQADLTHVHTILDLACGPGTWVQQIARMHPTIRLVGVDKNPSLIDYARTHVANHQRAYVQYQVMDESHPLTFPDGSFDLINCFLPLALLRTEQWPDFLNTCQHLLRPGGIIRLTAGELGISTAPAYEQYHRLLAHILFEGGYTFSPDGRHLGLTAVLPFLLLQADFQSIQKVSYVIDYSSMSERFDDWRHNLLLQVQYMTPYLVGSGMITEEEMQHISDRIQQELSWRFCATSTFVTVWATRG